MTGTRSLLLAAVVLSALHAGTARAEVKCLGASLPDGSRKVKDAAKDECRYVSSLSWDETMKFLGRNTSSATTRWHREVNIPAARYRHVENKAPKAQWEGINVYTLGQNTGEVLLYVIPRPEEPAAPAPKKPAGKSRRGKK